MKVNCNIYQAMVLGDPKGERNVDLHICGEKVEQTQSIKILGVNFRDHIRSVCKKDGGMIRILRVAVCKYREWTAIREISNSLYFA